ncbi:MAG: riboflavin synthase subunit alpha [Firmicutes bacterium ML8_F2]|nr:MAG: riboflavin synthase subunit alpha [Firmicutes bacterium ML8_F2]
MFTGLIEEQGTVRRIKISPAGAELVIGGRKVLEDLKTGDSIAVSGPCLTVTAIGRDTFTAWVMLETLSRTNLQQLAAGRKVNLERAAALGDRLGGHMVSGHIDSIVTLRSRRSEGEALICSFDVPPDLLRYIVPKGSVALEGVSLTVVEVVDSESRFSVGLIPHTAAQTTLGAQKIGDPVNLEVDLIGKYVEKMLAPRFEGKRGQEKKITISMLEENGYI